MKTPIYRTVRIKIKKVKLINAFKAQMLAAKNLYNIGVFIIRNLLSCFLDGVLKTELHENQKQVIELVNNSINIINANRIAKKALDSEYKPKLFELIDSKSTSPWVILNSSLFDHVLRNYTYKGSIPFASLPAKVSEQIRITLINNFKNWLAALKIFKSTPANFTGRPKMPGYLEKSKLHTITYPVSNLGTNFPTIEKRELYMDFNQDIPLSKDDIAEYDLIEILQLSTKLSDKLSFKGQKELIELRIVPKGSIGFETVYIEGVFKCELELAPSILSDLLPKALEMKENKRNAFYLDNLPKTNSIAGADLGLNNIISIAFGNGADGVVVSNSRIENKINLFDTKIDKLKATLTTDRQKQLQALQDQAKKDNTKLSRAEFIELRTLQKNIYNNKEYRELLNNRSDWIANVLHDVSKGVVDILVQNNIQVLVVGRNKGWKEDIELGKVFNRRFYQTAHLKLMQMLRYKCEEANILLVETEESYTSKRSFANNTPLSIYGKADPQQIDNGGVRAKNVYKTNIESRWSKIHADINGAYNIIRKVMPLFKVNLILSSKFVLYWVYRGLKIFKFKPGRGSLASI
jgi:putative transposase